MEGLITVMSYHLSIPFRSTIHKLCSLAVFLGVIIALPAEAQIAPSCHPRIESEFRSVLTEAAETGDYRLLRFAFGPNLEQLVGLECHPMAMRLIVEDAGFEVYPWASESSLDRTVLGRLPDLSLWGRLRDRDSGRAEVRISNGIIDFFQSDRLNNTYYDPVQRGGRRSAQTLHKSPLM